MDEFFMQQAIKEAKKAYELNEVPIGAIVSKEGRIIGTGYNRSINDSDPSGHAEIIALRDAGKKIGNYRLVNCNLYVTLEPCIMCLGAIFHARIKNLYFGAYVNKTGSCGGYINLLNNKNLNHHCKLHAGLLESEAVQILKEFFSKKREKKAANE
jgi:tRNA(adenine34) deaminase